MRDSYMEANEWRYNDKTHFFKAPKSNHEYLSYSTPLVEPSDLQGTTNNNNIGTKAY